MYNYEKKRILKIGTYFRVIKSFVVKENHEGEKYKLFFIKNECYRIASTYKNRHTFRYYGGCIDNPNITIAQMETHMSSVLSGSYSLDKYTDKIKIITS